VKHNIRSINTIFQMFRARQTDRYRILEPLYQAILSRKIPHGKDTTARAEAPPLRTPAPAHLRTPHFSLNDDHRRIHHPTSPTFSNFILLFGLVCVA
jgi:hypothetical protein